VSGNHHDHGEHHDHDGKRKGKHKD
jgi:hypothetical protein